MGYTHYWYRDPVLDAEAFERFVADCQRLVEPLRAAGVVLAGGHGTGPAEIQANRVCINGLEACGHTQRDLGITWPAPGARGVGHGGVAGAWFAGATLAVRTCGGDCSHETFLIERTIEVPDWQRKDRELRREGKVFECCKTAFKPYDLAVTAMLIAAQHHLGKQIRVTSDGSDADWKDGALLTLKVLHYGKGFSVEGE